MTLAIGFIVVCVLAMGVVIDVTSVFIARRALQAAVDSAALAGAQAIDLDAYYRHGASGSITLNPQLVRSRVTQQLKATPQVRLNTVWLEESTVLVRASTTMRPPLSGWLTPGGSRLLTAEAGAQLAYRLGSG